MARIKIDEEPDTITQNNFSQPYSYQPDNVESRPNRGEGRGGKNNAQVNRTGFDDNSQGGKNQNYGINKWNHDLRRNQEYSPEDDIHSNTNEYGDQIFNLDGSP